MTLRICFGIFVGLFLMGCSAIPLGKIEMISKCDPVDLSDIIATSDIAFAENSDLPLAEHGYSCAIRILRQQAPEDSRLPYLQKNLMEVYRREGFKDPVKASEKPVTQF